jgi:hypothetical protein
MVEEDRVVVRTGLVRMRSHKLFCLKLYNRWLFSCHWFSSTCPTYLLICLDALPQSSDDVANVLVSSATLRVIEPHRQGYSYEPTYFSIFGEVPKNA